MRSRASVLFCDERPRISDTTPTNKTMKMAQHRMHVNDRDAITKVTTFLVLRIQKGTWLEYTVDVAFCGNKTTLC
ncbi:hypothetical protein C1H46_014072 [Malus baccata]|uniref:Uncharacterized protein n=1 Tax=Malus baccata TaxID=106549 RepID=A0A540MNK6_MALBA|nr:hypothetical protein C1H46_014072 [Malus baccata]